MQFDQWDVKMKYPSSISQVFFFFSFFIKYAYVDVQVLKEERGRQIK